MLCWFLHVARHNARCIADSRLAPAPPMKGCNRENVGEERGETWGGDAPRHAPAEEGIADPAAISGQVKKSSGGGAVKDVSPAKTQTETDQIFTVFLFRNCLF